MSKAQEIVHQRYQLQQLLGQNIGRQTWLAKDLQAAEELVVVKLLAFDENVPWDNLKLFEREAAVLQQLHHPRIPTYRDYFAIDDRHQWFGLVQAYIPGRSVRECLTQGQKFSEEQVLQIAIDILEILIYLHELNPPVLHRDLKPSNLILGEDGHIFLVDFGAVQDRASAEGKSFTVVGTYGYTPIEQYGGRSVAASDLYALGATLIHLLTGITPADLPQDDHGKIAFRDRTSASNHLIQWIQRLIAPQVKQRHATARMALTALQEKPVDQPIQPISIQHPLPFRNHRFSSPPANTNIQVIDSPSHLKINIPSNVWTVVLGWGCIATIVLLFRPSLLSLVELLDLSLVSSYVWLLVTAMVSIVGIACYLTLKGLTNTDLEINQVKCCLNSSFLGKRYRQICFPRNALLYVAPQWRIMQKRNSGILEWLFWLASDKNEDNSVKVNVTLYTTERNYRLAPRDIRPTEANWLIDIIEDWLNASRISGESR